MLVEFRVKNFRSFKDEQTLSMVASSDKSLSENCAEQGKLRLLKTAGVYGPNASGKTNLIAALSTMHMVVVDSASSHPGQAVPVIPFRLEEETTSEPSLFEVSFFHREVLYQYGFTATSERIYDEWLVASPKSKAQSWFRRTYDHASGKTSWKFGPFLKGEKHKLVEKTRVDSLFLSVAAQWNNEQLAAVYDWFYFFLRVIPAGANLRQTTSRMIHAESKDTDDTRSYGEQILELLRSADLGIHEVVVRKEDPEEIEFPDYVPEGERRRYLQRVREEPELSVRMLHRNSETGEAEAFPLWDESRGTQRLFELSGPWIMTVEKGLTLLVDELELSLHPLISRELVKLIQDPKINRNGAQLIFTTHDTTLLDPELLRRDQIWLTEKGENGATSLYPLSDYHPRKDEAWQKGYLSGRYGAVPVLKAFGIK